MTTAAIVGSGNIGTDLLAKLRRRERIEVRYICTGLDVPALLAAAAETALPIIPRLPWAERNSIVQGYAGVYSSFLPHASERYGVPAYELLQRAGEARNVGGQEDMIIDIAM